MERLLAGGDFRVLHLQALEKAHRCKQEAARILGISLRTLYYKIQRYGVEERSAAKNNTGTDQILS